MFAFPIPTTPASRSAQPIGYWVDKTGRRPPPLEHLYLGPGFDDAEIENQLRQCGLAVPQARRLADATAELLASGKVVGWFQGRMEGGPRALGGRSILADPRTIARARSRQRGDQVPRVLAAVLPEPDRGVGRPVT